MICKQVFDENQITRTGAGVACLDCAQKVQGAVIAKYAQDEAVVEQAVAEANHERQLARNVVRALVVPDPDILTSEIVDRLGGVEGLANLYVAQVMEAAQRNPGSRTAIQALKWVAEMVDKIAERQLKRSRLSAMSDEDLEALVSDLISQRMEAIPGGQKGADGEKDEAQD